MTDSITISRECGQRLVELSEVGVGYTSKYQVPGWEKDPGAVGELRAALASPPSPPSSAMREALPDDLRARGLTVAVHNDYRINGEAWTFWLFTTPDGRALKGEGRTDAEALNQVRAALSSPPSSAMREALARCAGLPEFIRVALRLGEILNREKHPGANLVEAEFQLRVLSRDIPHDIADTIERALSADDGWEYWDETRSVCNGVEYRTVMYRRPQKEQV